MKVCRRCAEELPDDARVCTQCGQDPDQAAPSVSRPSVPAVDPIPWIPGTAGPTGMSGIEGDRPAPERTPSNTLAVASLFVAVLAYGVSLFSNGMALVTYVIAIGLGLGGMSQVRGSSGRQRGFEFAVIGTALGVIGALGSLRHML